MNAVITFTSMFSKKQQQQQQQQQKQKHVLKSELTDALRLAQLFWFIVVARPEATEVLELCAGFVFFTICPSFSRFDLDIFIPKARWVPQLHTDMASLIRDYIKKNTHTHTKRKRQALQKRRLYVLLWWQETRFCSWARSHVSLSSMGLRFILILILVFFYNLPSPPSIIQAFLKQC